MRSIASVSAESVATVSATGPSTVARIIQNEEIVEAAKRIVKALGLSGMIGFDFMIEAATGNAYLIEMNPRNTPICALRLGAGRDLAEALVARLSARPVRERPPRTEHDIVAFFPDTWQEDPKSQFLHTGFHDVPWEYPDLVRLLMQPERRERYRVLRLLRKIWLATNAKRGDNDRVLSISDRIHAVPWPAINRELSIRLLTAASQITRPQGGNNLSCLRL